MKNPQKKPEHLTHLNGNLLVSKTHNRIVFRGAVDTLEAEVIEAQVLAVNAGELWYSRALAEILALLRNIMKAEVTNTALLPFRLFDLSEEELHSQSHNIKEIFGLANPPLPDHTMNPLALRLNYLRARTREAEILAIKAFEEEPLGSGIITALNRLSSAFWWLYCRLIAV